LTCCIPSSHEKTPIEQMNNSISILFMIYKLNVSKKSKCLVLKTSL